VSRTFGRSAAAVALLLVVSAAPVAAQGHRGLGKTKRHGAPDPVIPGTGVRQFGIWLEDASLSPVGQGWASFGIGYTSAPFGHQWDAPSMDAGVGLLPRVQVGVTAPFTKISYTDGTTDRGLGDVYLAVKVGILDPAAEGRTFGLAVTPIVEFLSAGSVPQASSRTHWAIPLALEKRFEKFRTYGTVGYFSRGAVFASAAFEMPLNEKLTATATLSHARSIEDDPLSEARDLSPTRWDVSGGAAYFFTPRVTLNGSIGRTISSIDANASSLSVAAGMSFGFQHRLSGRRQQPGAPSK
jgi:hypothetical protein